MAAAKFLNLLAIFSLASLVCIFNATPSNALSVEFSHHHIARGHDAVAKRKRASKCRPRTTIKPTSTKAATKTPAPNPPPSNNSGKKVMLSWAIGDNSKAANNAVGPRVGAVHTWSLDVPSVMKNKGLKFFPTIWGEKDVSKITSKLKGANGDVMVLTFNEPQERGQSNLSPARAAQLWKQHIQPLRAKGYKLCCPATSGNPNGITWMKNFFKECNGGCTCDGHGVHFYDNTFEKLQNWINEWRQFKKPLILSEYADHNFNGPQQPSKSQADAFYKKAVPWLESQPDILYHAPFGWFTGGNEGGVNNNVLLLKSDGSLTDLGRYVSYR